MPSNSLATANIEQTTINSAPSTWASCRTTGTRPVSNRSVRPTRPAPYPSMCREFTTIWAKVATDTPSTD